MSWSPSLIELEVWGAATLKEETPTQVFSCEYHKIFKNSFFIEHLRWLLLKMVEEFLIQTRFVEKNLKKRKIYINVP